MDLRSFFEQNRLQTTRPIINNLGVGTVIVSTRSDTQAVYSPSALGKAWLGTRKITRFVITTLLIFGVVQVGLNFQAYKQQYEFFREKQLAIKDPQKEILKSLQVAPAANATISTTQVAQADTTNVEDSFTLRPEVINFRNYEVAPSDNRIVIGKIGKNVPIVQVSDEKLLTQDYAGLEQQIQEQLLKGIVHYPGTAKPGEIGNSFFTGHSSNYPWISSAYNAVLALLQNLVVGDKVTVYWEGQKFIYQVYDIKTVSPTETWVLQQSGNEYDSILTLMTCTPVGTSLNRLIVRAQQIYPDPQKNTPPTNSVIAPNSLISS